MGAITEALASERVLLIKAPPGAGKTTEVPRALLKQTWRRGSIIATQPRRLAAKLAAHYVASLMEQPVGGTVGYRVRFDEKVGRSTELVFETEGLLLRRLLGGASLDGVSTVIIDEVHERSQSVDCLLALLLKRQKNYPELRLVLMSATLDAPELAAALGSARVIESQGRGYPIEISHEEKPDDRPLPARVRSAVLAADATEGDLLVFLPGAREIRDALRALDGRSRREILTLHGDLPLQEQSAVTRGGSGRPRVILSTNVAESSVTIPGVTMVIDSGLARVAYHDFLSGAVRLKTAEVSQARLTQRAGRAGRTAPGTCVRLFSRGSLQSRPLVDTPEILRTDLTEMQLLLSRAGLRPDDLPWVSPPEASRWERAQSQLEGLGALQNGELTNIGERMAELPVPPRLARVIAEAHRLGCVDEACRVAALLSERDLRRRPTLDERRGGSVVSTDSDIDDRLSLLERAEAVRFSAAALRSEGIDPTVARSVSQVSAQLKRICQRWPKALTAPPQGSSQALKFCLLTGFFDRVAERRADGQTLLLSSGAQAQLSHDSGVTQAHYLLALSTLGGGEGRNAIPIVQIALRLAPDDLLDALPENVSFKDEARYDKGRDRVDLRSLISYGKLILSESITKAGPGELRDQALLAEALTRGEAAYDPEGRLESLGVRLLLLFEQDLPSTKGLGSDCKELLALASDHARLCERALQVGVPYFDSMAGLRQANLAELALSTLAPELTPIVARELPERIVLPGGRELSIRYKRGQPPHAASRLQDFFSMAETPKLLSGRLPLQLHLLAPNRRAIQITTDLRGFWERHYPELRRALMRRYPKHSWPEDGLTAAPPPKGRLR